MTDDPRILYQYDSVKKHVYDIASSESSRKIKLSDFVKGTTYDKPRVLEKTNYILSDFHVHYHFVLLCPIHMYFDYHIEIFLILILV